MTSEPTRTGEPGYWQPSCPAGKHDDQDYVAEHFDPYSIELTRGRFVRVSNELRDRCPVTHSDTLEAGFYAVHGYAEIDSIHRDPKTFSSFPCTIPPFGNTRPMLPIESDPPLHRSYRGPLLDHFSRGSQRAKSEEYRAIVTECIDSFIDRGSADLATELCTPLTVRALMEMLGVPEGDRDGLEDIATRMIRQATADPAAAAVELMGYFTSLVELRRREPADDVVSQLCKADIAGVPLTDTEILDYCMLLVPAGFETTASSMGYMFLILAERADLQDQLRAEPERIPAALEEFLRYATPVRGLSRTVMAETELAGKTLRRGDRILMNWVGANHDPAAFSDPDEIDIDRRPNRHFGFGLGAHLCLGIHMAREELRVAFEETLSRMHDIRVADPAGIVEEPGTTWGITNLPVTFRAATGAGA
jgi:cytochrome P450